MQAVIRASKKFLPSMAAGFEHPKVKIHIGDGFAFLEDKVDSFDVIITDSSDPVGKLFFLVLGLFPWIFRCRKKTKLKQTNFVNFYILYLTSL